MIEAKYRAEAFLKKVFNNDSATFRDGQWEKYRATPCWKTCSCGAAYGMGQKYGLFYCYQINAITAIRRKEQSEMQDYMRHKGCLMTFLQTALDDKKAKSCGNCMNCAPDSKLDDQCQLSLVRSAQAFLKNLNLIIEPRKQWPFAGIFKFYNFDKRNIPPNLQAEVGRALCLYGDAGWGSLVREGKYRSGKFDQKLVEACVSLYRKWNVNPAPKWVTCIPYSCHQFEL
ncbi:MAG: hypothetical protein PUB69_06635 [Desulfovibrionaceae bacterium]|nr:hypothetical protein [Desulfovibrionaceae bacterium]